MTDVFAPVREARRLWERTAPQLTLEVDGLSETGDCDPPVSLSASLTPLPDARLSAPANSPLATAGTRPAELSDPRTGAKLLSDPSGGAGRGSALTHNNGDRRSTLPGSAAVASQETS